MIQRPTKRPHVAKPVQVAARITNAIDKGTFHPGDRLPSERELAAKYQVSRDTVREAVALLQEEGRVHVRHGLGTFVSGGTPDVGRRPRSAKYPQIAEAIAADIDAGRYKPGDLLPSELELGARHKVSRHTVREAMALLREQGRVETVHAKGTYVTGEKTSAPVPPSRRLVEDLRDAITSGRLKPGDPLPPEKELMDTYGLAAITITIALRKLRQEGLIHHIPGRGRFAGPAPGQRVD